MEKKEILEKTSEIKESAVRLFKQVDASLGFNGRLAVIFGLVIIGMLGMVLDRVDTQDHSLRAHRDEFRQEKGNKGDMRISFDQENLPRQRMQMFDESFDNDIQQMDQMKNNMERMMKKYESEDDIGNLQDGKSDSILGRIENKVSSFFGQNKPVRNPNTISSESRIELSPSTSIQKISVNDSTKQFTVNDENGTISGYIITSQDTVTKLSEAIKSLGLETSIKDTTISFTGKLQDLNQLLKVLEAK